MGTDDFEVKILLKRLNLFLRMLGVPSRVQLLDLRAEEAWLGRPVTETTTMRQLVAFLYEDIDALEAIRLGLSVFGARATTEGGLILV